MSVPTGLLNGQVALVTGGARGIGRAIAAAFSAAGAEVAVADVHLESATGHALEVRTDISDPRRVEALFGAVQEQWGRLDILVNNAGILANQPVLQLTEDAWDRVLAVNLKGQFLCAQAAARLMARRGTGCIINISSIRARKAAVHHANYIASKGGVEALTRALALELAPHGIRVNCIAPGAIQTEINRDALGDPAFRARVLDRIPLARLGQPEDVAGVAVFLASDLARFVTGSIVPVDGGEAATG